MFKGKPKEAHHFEGSLKKGQTHVNLRKSPSFRSTLGHFGTLDAHGHTDICLASTGLTPYIDNRFVVVARSCHSHHMETEKKMASRGSKHSPACLVQGWCIIDTVTSHSSNLAHALNGLHDFLGVIVLPQTWYVFSTLESANLLTKSRSQRETSK